MVPNKDDFLKVRGFRFWHQIASVPRSQPQTEKDINMYNTNDQQI